MMTRALFRNRLTTLNTWAGAVALAAVVSLVVDKATAAVDFSVGAAEQIYSSSKRKSKKLSTWPDGNLGVIPLGNGLYDFYGANGSKPVKTTGTLLDPGTKKKSVKITGLPKKTFNYVSGGPVYQDPTSGARLMIYHAEKHGKSAKDFYSVLGMAVSTDAAGRVFQDLGTIIEPNLQVGQTEVGGGPFAVMDGYMHVYYRDWFPGVTTSELAVARAPISEVISNALSGIGTNFNKYYNGSWTEPGRGGLSSYLETGNPNNGWTAVSYNEYLDELVMVSAQWSPTNPGDLYMATSSDGINFSPRQAVAIDPGEQFYPTIIGTGADPQRSGKSFYVYYTDSQKGAWSRWSDAKLMRREITLDPLAAPASTPSIPIVSPGPSQPPAPVETGWVVVSDFRNEYQAHAPASGWTYAWNPTGKLGDATKFTPLTWSDTIFGYNTTGAANRVPTSSSHKDDYLHLTGDGGHPGKPGYMPIVGYTIQADDGAGLYRIADSSISKSDSILSKSEDGLEVLLYRNDTLLGKHLVANTGDMAAFNRELGQLNVGDTIWVMVNAGKNQYYDSFSWFDFTLQKSIPLEQALAIGATIVPEPATAMLLLVSLCVVGGRRRRPQGACGA